MFYECRNLNELNLSNFSSKNVDDKADMFTDCFRLKKFICSDKEIKKENGYE